MRAIGIHQADLLIFYASTSLLPLLDIVNDPDNLACPDAFGKAEESKEVCRPMYVNM